jgi:hypothetical protein
MASSYYFKDITLLITHYNRSSSLERLLKACKDLNCTFEDIVVSDDCSQQEHIDKIYDLQKEYTFRLITAPENRGLGNNINKGQAAVNTPYTLYIQEDFVPLPAFPEHFIDAYQMMEEEPDLDFVRFYSYIRYPTLKPYKMGYSRLVYNPWSPFYYKIYYYTDHPHLRRSDFLKKFGQYTEGVSVDRSEYRMCIAFIQQGGKGLFYTQYKTLLEQKNPESEPSTTPRDRLTMSKNPIIKLVRNLYRQCRYNYDLLMLRPNYGYAIHSDAARVNIKENILTTAFKSLIDKVIGVFVKLRYPNVDMSYKRFYKVTYLCMLTQLKYIYRDYVSKGKYKTISFNGEFAPEIQFALPFAYWHYKNGTLRKTRSSKYTREFYFFSEDHEESFEVRSDEGNYNFEMPRILYSQNYNMRKWLPVPLKEKYKNEVYRFDKPLLIIANRYNMEWNEAPVSYFDIPVLDSMISKLKSKYSIVYNRPRPQNIISDDSEIYDLNEYDWLRKEHPEVILMDDLMTENKANARNFNHLQLMVYANADHFISIHGGTATLASYFGGINLILSKKGPEHHFNCYQTLYPKLSGAKIIHAKTDEELDMYIERYFSESAL